MSDSTVGDFLVTVGITALLGTSIAAGIAKCSNRSARNEALDNAALKVDLEKTFSPNKSVFQYKSSLFKTMAQQVDFVGSISREKVILCMQDQLKSLIKDLPNDQKKWGKEDEKIYQYAAKTLIDYVNSDKDGYKFFDELRKDILDYKIASKEEKQERLPQPNELPLTQLQLKQFKERTQNMG